MSDKAVPGSHWAAHRERGSFALMKLTAAAVRLLGRRAMAPLLYLIVLYFYLFGRSARQSAWAYQCHLADWSGRRDLAPSWRSVFGQFTGCAALTCAYAGCNAHFCAFCLADCGSDAHPHVRTCRLNPKQNEYFVSEAVWARVVDGERRRKLQAYWATLEAGLQDALAAFGSVGQILRDLKLDRLLGAASYAEQVAQLRGMGFTDERAMRRALGEVGGDVAAALEML